MDVKLGGKSLQTVAMAEEQHLASVSVKKTKTKKVTKKVVKSISAAENEPAVESCTAEETKKHSKLTSISLSNTSTEKHPTMSNPDLNEVHLSSATETKKKSKDTKKNRAKLEKGNQSISVRSSFSKFDALQKRNLNHTSKSEKELNCRVCSKAVYKMEEVKAEKAIFHKNCFRCRECNKQLSVDNYYSHESVLYCSVHFKLLFAPKCVESGEPEIPKKPELIIRENQPLELPADVVRASDKPDLGLQELQQLNVRSRFQMFENVGHSELTSPISKEPPPVKRSSSIIQKMGKLQSKGISTDLSMFDMQALNNVSDDEQVLKDEDDSDIDLDLVRSTNNCQYERPIGLGHAMEDIKNRFEKGNLSKEERREERKQEIQNIRSRLFMGKQAKIKEMYQQAVAESEQAITSTGKNSEIDVGENARFIKNRFENGEMFKKIGSDEATRIKDESDVFESAISKQSRSMFVELDANAASRNHTDHQMLEVKSKHSKNSDKNVRAPSSTSEVNGDNNLSCPDIVRHDEKPEDVKIQTSEISSKFNFFETYQPTKSEKKQFRITPPREGVVKMPESEPDTELNEQNDVKIVERSQSTSIILNKFRELELVKNKSKDAGPKPLKCFTPPPEDERRIYEDDRSEYDSDTVDDSDEIEDNDFSYKKPEITDEALKEAQAAARAKQLRAKFEKWEEIEMRQELNDGHVNIYSQEVSNDETIESTKALRERFESLKTANNIGHLKPRHQVNRFV